MSKEQEQRCLELADMIDGKPIDRTPTLQAGIDEATFQQAITDLADEHGWEWHHQTVSQRSKSGWPDLPMFRERAIYVEVKAEDGRLSADQERWRDILIAAGQEYYCWKPSDWPEVLRVITTPNKLLVRVDQ